jgi:hypothetical protein
MMQGFEFDADAALAAGRSWETVAMEMSDLIQGMLADSEEA